MNNLVWKRTNLFKAFLNSLKQYGIVDTIKGVASYLWRQVLYVFYPIYYNIFFRKKRQFVFQKRSYNYCVEKYNLSWRSERTIEIPIIQELIKLNSELNVLEIGCVLKHYKSSPEKNWTIVDKYEKFQNVINEDIVNYKPLKKYDLIVSVSTIEHIGMEDGAIDPDKAMHAINFIISSCLNKNGRFVFTIPIGYNKNLDKQIFNNEIAISEKYYFFRISKYRWIEVIKNNVLDSVFNDPYAGSNALFIGIINK